MVLAADLMLGVAGQYHYRDHIYGCEWSTGWIMVLANGGLVPQQRVSVWTYIHMYTWYWLHIRC